VAGAMAPPPTTDAAKRVASLRSSVGRCPAREVLSCSLSGKETDAESCGAMSPRFDARALESEVAGSGAGQAWGTRRT
jgi:hypothetical protein